MTFSPTSIRHSAKPRLGLVSSPRTFDLRLPTLPLERGGAVSPHHARGWWWGPFEEAAALDDRAVPPPAPGGHEVVRRAQPVPPRPALVLDPKVPTVLLVHALTGDARAGGEGGWWAPLIGPGRPLDPTRHRLLCFNNLGSCYGSSGPLDPGFPAGARLTTVDQARALWLALDELGLERVHLAVGGSLGGMVVLALAALRPRRVERVMPLGATAEASAWVVGFNHVQRQAIALDPDRGLELARQLAVLTYRAEPGLDAAQGRHDPGTPRAGDELKVASYLEHQGDKLRRRFDAASYLALLDAMDAHDLLGRRPGLDEIRASALVVDIASDQLFTSARVQELARRLQVACHVETATLRSPHGHDAFLLEWDALQPLVRRALELPGSPR
jgi:homoserine O-acetyltransferase/O-succinyltransferase